MKAVEEQRRLAPINIQMAAMENLVYLVFYLLLKCDMIEETLETMQTLETLETLEVHRLTNYLWNLGNCGSPKINKLGLICQS